jgi:D-arabinose 1-dehydrogenase-like Zn-dependent alcohol dehydrogenase
MSKMRAMIVSQPGGPLRMEERELPEPGPHEVRIRVQACGVCHSDALTIMGGPMPGLAYPRVPGHEVIGTVDARGADVQGWELGTRAGVGWFGGSCGYCDHCRRGDAFACENIHAATGVSRDGGYATHILALASALAHVPADLDAVESAPLLCAGVTTFNDGGQLAPEEHLATACLIMLMTVSSSGETLTASASSSLAVAPW